ncbi:MAG: TonB-dependent receptor [Acidobacteria bacterium]|nr:TonB-dependent receptor [Acidobacteriota bacterium]
MSLARIFRAVLAAALLASIPAWPQTNVGQISGKVFDSTGAVVPKCAITATNLQTGLQQSATTDEGGTYSFASLPRGTYTVRAEASGFRSSEQSGVVLDAATRRAVDFTLVLGALSEAISVVAAADQVQTTSGDVSQLITERQLTQIALNGRNYVQMLQLVPGVVATSTDPFSLGLNATAQRINGIRTNSIYFMVDGTDNMDNGANSNAIINPNIDAIAEIKILTSSYSAEFGGRAGAIMNVVMKGGTREFHGSLFEFVRNDSFDARSFFAKTTPPLRFNNFGWTLGGPLYIPGKWNADKNKWFFFAGQEWKYNHQGVAQISTVPTQEERAGDFRNSSLPAPVDPLTGQAFANRTVPAARFSKNGPSLLKPYPLPNFGGPGGNYSINGVNRTDTREDLLKVDYILSPNTQVSYRWTHDEFDIWNAFQGGNTGIVPGGRPRPGWTTIASLRQTLSPTMLNSFSFSVTANQIKGNPQLQILKRSTLGLTYPEIFANNQYQVGPNLNISGFTGYTVGERMQNAMATFQWRDDFSKVAGAHTLKFGTQITRSRKDQNNSGANENGTVTFNISAARTSRNVIADVLLGNFQNYTEGQVDTWMFARFTQVEFYAQDSWRVNRKLSLELGLRYNIIGPIYSALGNFTTFLPGRFDPAKAPQVDPRTGALAGSAGDPYNGIVILGSGFPKAAIGRIPAASDPSLSRLFGVVPRGGKPINYRDFGPRFGFAYDPFGNGKASVRGGFGIFYDLMQTNYIMNSQGNPPFVSSASVYDGNIDNPGAATTQAFPPDLSVISTTHPDPRVMSFNLGVQRQLPGAIIADVSYVGTLGRNLNWRTINLNQLRQGARLNAPQSGINVNALRPFPGYGNINMNENGESSNYNSLQVAVNRRLERGLSFGVNYTFSRALDSSSGTPQNAYDARPDYGLASIHRKHVLNLNYVYDLPFFRRHSNALVRNTLGGWELSGITSFQSGAPSNVTVPVDVARIGVSSSRASVAGDPKLSAGQRTLTRWFNTEAFLPPEKMVQGRFGDSGRNILIGPGFSQWDVALLKNFRLREKLNLQFRAESFNLWNHAAFTGINTTVRFDAAGKPTQNYGAVTSSGPGRILSFGLKLIF